MRGQKHLCSHKACSAKPREGWREGGKEGEREEERREERKGESNDLGLFAQIAEIGREVNWKW